MALSHPILDPAIVPVAVARALRREYRLGGTVVAALRGVDLTVDAGERVAIMGPSGCGKSTLLSLIGGLDRPSAGTVLLAGHDLNTCSRTELAHIRRSCLGYVPQNAALLPMLTVEENVALPLNLVGVEPDARRERVHELLDRVGMAHKRAA